MSPEESKCKIVFLSTRRIDCYFFFVSLRPLTLRDTIFKPCVFLAILLFAKVICYASFSFLSFLCDWGQYHQEFYLPFCGFLLGYLT